MNAGASKTPSVKTLSVGSKAPAFSVLTDQGTTIRSSDLLGKSFVLYFYPKDNTPGCTTESCDFRDQYQEFRKAGIEIYGVSKDSVKSHVGFRSKFTLPFTLLSDEDGKMCEAYGVWKEKSNYGKTYMGIERTTVVVGSDGKIRKIYPKVSVTGHVAAILKDLDIHE